MTVLLGGAVLRGSSGRRDSNSRSPAPKAGALARLGYVPWAALPRAPVDLREVGRRTRAARPLCCVRARSALAPLAGRRASRVLGRAVCCPLGGRRRLGTSDSPWRVRPRVTRPGARHDLWTCRWLAPGCCAHYGLVSRAVRATPCGVRRCPAPGSELPSTLGTFRFGLQQVRRDSNPRHPVLETGALARLSYAPTVAVLSTGSRRTLRLCREPVKREPQEVSTASHGLRLPRAGS